MKKIGITGGIGSGKSTVCEIFKLLGVAVFHADMEARNLQDNDLQIKNQLMGLFGKDIYFSDGQLDRKKLADLVFNDKMALAKVNSIVHPAVIQHFINWCGEHLNDEYILYEAAILIESGHAPDFEKNILVVADEKARIERATIRDLKTEEQVKKIIYNQMADILKISFVDYVIENNHERLLIPQVIELDKKIREGL